jgi:hypothetical protein
MAIQKWSETSGVDWHYIAPANVRLLLPARHRQHRELRAIVADLAGDPSA